MGTRAQGLNDEVVEESYILKWKYIQQYGV